MTQPARRSTQGRGFLFADLRGYTAFAEARRDAAAAELLRTYRALVRAAIARFDGAEIRTEGDSFYVVFPSATDAVSAGLAILTDAAEASDGAPLRVGIGVHAGETTETDEGYVGGAVNIAARVCAIAGPGELFVTDTVRALARGQLDVQFIPRGRKRLKGIAEPIAVYAVVSGEPRPARRWSRSDLPSLAGLRLKRIAVPLALAGGVLILTAGAIALIDPSLFGRAPAEPSPPAAATSSGSAVPSPPSPVPSEPNEAESRAAAEDRLRQRIDPDVARLCTSADPQDAPRVIVDFGEQVLEPLRTLGGLRCELGGGAGPDVVFYWRALRETEANEDPGTEGAFLGIVGQRNLPPGDCSTDTRAWEQWEFGSASGKILCSQFGGEALLMWIYNGDPVIAEAVREDGDNERLYRWWEDHARLLAPEPDS